ncbi:uncharacterized protein N7529_008736 [Penicillium soppii]|uniref:uncharacterized protein n=1 Tax=Penicillium soppii TaxID=69789 RepID=UPI0025497151|nr:uncharacterized protein N7529_008736 [Penicillium soppii]KAJ5861426.1 hypothetical protein N7529_008736 [Penicillium soppii]
MAQEEKLKKSHMAIVLGIGLGVVLLIVLSLIERLRKLDKVSPTCTLEKWWTTTKGNLGLSEAVDGQFVWYVHARLITRAAVNLCAAQFVWSK